MSFKVVKPRINTETVESFAAQADQAPPVVTSNNEAGKPLSSQEVPKSETSKKAAPAVKPTTGEGGLDEDPEIMFNLRIRRSDHARLQALAEQEERSMQFIAKKLFRAGLDEAEAGKS